VIFSASIQYIRTVRLHRLCEMPIQRPFRTSLPIPLRGVGYLGPVAIFPGQAKRRGNWQGHPAFLELIHDQNAGKVNNPSIIP